MQVFNSLIENSQEAFNLLFTFAQSSGGQMGYTSLIMMVGIIVIFYFFMIRPQQKRQKELKAQIAAIAKGDKILTIGGIYADVTAVKDDRITAEISDGVRIEVSKTAVASVVSKA